MMADKWALEKAQALQDVEERFNQETARILSCYQLPKQIRLDLQEQHLNDYKVPDDLRVKFINAVSEGNPWMLDHQEELKIQARKESDKFWVETAAAAKKAQALQDMAERERQQIFKHAPGIQDMPHHIKEKLFREFKVHEDQLINFKNHVEHKFGIGNQETRLRVRAWEESQRFRINIMGDKWAAKKVQALQDLEKRDVQCLKKEFDRQNIPESAQQACLEDYEVPDYRRLIYINDIEDKFRMPDDEDEEPKGYISKEYNKLKEQALQDIEERFNQQTSRILKCYDLPEHIRLDLQVQHCNDYKVPDDLRLKFVNAVFEGNPWMLDHQKELKIHARKESDKFWIKAAATEKKAQALLDMAERDRQQFFKHAPDIQDIPDHIKKKLFWEFKVHDDQLINFKNHVEHKFGIGNQETRLRVRAWEESQRFRINTMADKWAAKKVQALQDLEKRNVQGLKKEFDSQNIPEYAQQACLEDYEVPDYRRLIYINDIEDKFWMPDDEEEEPKGCISEEYNKLKVQALQDMEERFNQQTSRILKCYDLPEHIRLDLQEQHCNDYKVPDDLRVKFINAVFKGSSEMLNHQEELKVQAQKESEKFWIKAAATEKKAQALQDMEERYKQLFVKPSFDREGIPENNQEYFLRECKLDDDAWLVFKNNVEEKFAIRNHEMQLKIRAWEKTQQFRIEIMADKRAKKKTKALQDMEERYIQDFMNIVERLDVPEYIQHAYSQEYKVPDDIRLRYINHIEGKFRTLVAQEELKVHIWENFKKLKMPLTNKSLTTVGIMLSIGVMILLSSFLVPEMPKSLKIVCWAISIVISYAAVLIYDHGSSKRSLLTTAPTETHDLENPPSNY